MALRFVLVCAASTGVGAQIPPACKSPQKPEFMAELKKFGERGPAEAFQRCMRTQQQSPAVKAVTDPGGVCEGKGDSVSICSSPACMSKAKEIRSNMNAQCIPAGYPLLREVGECMSEHMCDGPSITDSMAIAGMPQIMEMIARASLDNSNGKLMMVAKPSDKCCLAVRAAYEYATDPDVKTAAQDPATAQKVLTEITALEKAQVEACADVKDRKTLGACIPATTMMVSTADKPQTMLAGFCGFLAGAAVVWLAAGLKKRSQTAIEQPLTA